MATNAFFSIGLHGTLAVCLLACQAGRQPLTAERGEPHKHLVGLLFKQLKQPSKPPSLRERCVRRRQAGSLFLKPWSVMKTDNLLGAGQKLRAATNTPILSGKIEGNVSIVFCCFFWHEAAVQRWRWTYVLLSQSSCMGHIKMIFSRHGRYCLKIILGSSYTISVSAEFQHLFFLCVFWLLFSDTFVCMSYRSRAKTFLEFKRFYWLSYLSLWIHYLREPW